MTKTLIITLFLFNLFVITHAQLNVHFQYKLYDGLQESEVVFITEKLNENIDRICNNLNVVPSDTFIIHIWNNYENYLIAQEEYLGQRFEGSQGYVLGRTVMAVYNSSYANEVAEHEFAHCISLHLNNTFGNNPRWLWEAVAIYEANEFYNPSNLSYLQNQNYPSIAELNGNFNTGGNKIYEVGYLIAEFILDKWGKEKYIELIESNGNTASVLSISESEFESQWKAFVENKYFNRTDIACLEDADEVLTFKQETKELYLNIESSSSFIVRVFNTNGTLLANREISPMQKVLQLNYLCGINVITVQVGDQQFSKKVFVK